MVGEVYDTYNDFCKSFEELKTYENTQLAEAKKVVETLFISVRLLLPKAFEMPLQSPQHLMLHE